MNWNLPGHVPKSVSELVVQNCTDVSSLASMGRIAFSALDAGVAESIERGLAEAGMAVFSNTRCYRRHESVPILLPVVNPLHIEAIHSQPWSGSIVCNANCASTGLVVALQPLQERFGIAKLFITTMQACSGAGFPGVPSLQMIDNVVPYISGEEDKLQYEPCKILGTWNAGGAAFEPLELRISAACNRVAVQDGHMASVSIQFVKENVTVEMVNEALETFTSPVSDLKLPSAPQRPVQLFKDDPSRPQPRLDRDAGNGFVVSVGNVRPCTLFDVKFTVLSHNTIIGAAGGAILNAEFAMAKDLISLK